MSPAHLRLWNIDRLILVRLYRLYPTLFTTKPSGMGMGLSISRSIIRAHGGRLWVSPNPDHGAAFQFTVPINGSGVS
jgi:signal transduction histidine kinase